MSRCSFDPMIYRDQPIGMLFCPECGEMVLAGSPHPDYDAVNDPFGMEPTMNDAVRENVMKQLSVLPEVIENRMTLLANAKVSFMNMKANLQELEDNLILGGTINGKNAEERGAQLRKATATMRGAVLQAEADFIHAGRDLDAAQTQFAAIRAMARMLAVTKGEE